MAPLSLSGRSRIWSVFSRLLEKRPIKSLLVSAWLPYAIVLLILCIELIVKPKHWVTNDDAGMSMIAQGKGIAAYPSPGLVFSNVAWGWVTMQIPSIGNISGYALATYTLLIASLLAVMASLRRLGASSWLGALLLFLMYSYSLAAPQFTIVGGYMAVAGVMVLFAWKEADSVMPMYVAGFLLFLAGLVRILELIFVVGVSLPFIAPSTRSMLSSRPFKRTAAVAVALIALLFSAHILNTKYYASDEWATFRNINAIRLLFTDYKVSDYILDHPETLKDSGFNENDVRLMSNWFFQDHAVFRADKLVKLVNRIPWAERIGINTEKYTTLLNNFHDSQFRFLFFALLLLLIINWRRDTRPWLAFTLFLGCMYGLLLLGRAGVTRVYIAPISVISLLLLARLAPESRLRMHAAGMIGLTSLLAVLLTPPVTLGGKFNFHHTVAGPICEAGRGKLLILWGKRAFPYLKLYRPDTSGPPCNLDLYSIGSLQFAPYELSNLYDYTGATSLAEALLRGQTLYMFTDSNRLKMLRSFFRDHYSVELSAKIILHDTRTHLYELRTTSMPPATVEPTSSSMRPADSNTN